MQRSAALFTPGEHRVLLFTLAYFSGFTAWFVTRGDYEFIVYSVTMAALILLIAVALRRVDPPLPLIWGLSLWGLAHQAGGAIPVGDGVLYGAVVLPVAGSGELAVLKYDQVVHALGTGLIAWVLWHVMATTFPPMRRSWLIYIYSAFAAMGIGATHEMVEFTAVLSFPETNVGGYHNNALDLVFNAFGAVAAMALVARAESRR